MVQYIVLFFWLAFVPKIESATTVEVDYQEFWDLKSPIPLEREAKLTVVQGESLYYSSRATERGLCGKDWKGNTIKGASITSSSSAKDMVPEGTPLFRVYNVDPYGNSVYTTPKAGVMKVRNIERMSIIYDEPIPKIKWKIHKDSVKSIGDYSCIRATADFKGRSYEAWFSPEIPLNSGPWKLRGVPGLILEASDKAGKIKFVATKISFSQKKVDFASDVKEWTGRRCTFEQSKTIGLERSIKDWIKRTSLGFDSKSGNETSLTVNPNDFLEIYPKEHGEILKKYKKYMTVR